MELARGTALLAGILGASSVMWRSVTVIFMLEMWVLLSLLHKDDISLLIVDLLHGQK